MKLKLRSLPSGSYYRAIFIDPDTGKETYVKLDPLSLPNEKARREWAIDKAKSLSRRRMELESGAPRATGTALSKAVQAFFDAPSDRRERTVEIYRNAADKFEAWCGRHSIESADELTRARLIEFRESIAATKKRAPKKRGKRGGREETSRRRSPASINQELRSVRTILGYLHEKDLLPKLTFDDLRRGLKLQKATKELPEFLSSHECQRLLDATLRHDAETHLLTRAEHQGLRLVGSTERYDAIAPFTAFLLLSGCRIGEALSLRWRDVHLDALDADGNKVGQIHLRATAVKTGAARKVDLDVCPTLRAMLAAMKLRAGDDVYVFGGAEPLSRAQVEAARKRLIGDARYGSRGRNRKRGKVREIQVAGFGSPQYSWQLLRSTCATVSCNAPSLWGTAAPFVSAKRLGHSVVVSERRYSGQLAVSREARTLEAAMGIEKQMAQIVARVSSPVAARLATVSEVGR